jgi:uncharacterized BrkB/YihY/UPF0761 family membrane protein
MIRKNNRNSYLGNGISMMSKNLRIAFVSLGLVFILLFFVLPRNLSWIKDILSVLTAVIVILVSLKK